VERLRDFKSRIERVQLPTGKNVEAQSVADRAKRGMREGMEDDLNTAQALAAIFDMVREANTMADRGELRQDDKAPLLEALQQFDEIFAVLTADDGEKKNSDEDVERLIAERTAAKKARDFARSDAIRKQLADAGIVIEDAKDGVRWKRK
jgi:cysteinyl-tRNA synthetase